MKCRKYLPSSTGKYKKIPLTNLVPSTYGKKSTKMKTRKNGLFIMFWFLIFKNVEKMIENKLIYVDKYYKMYAGAYFFLVTFQSSHRIDWPIPNFHCSFVMFVKSALHLQSALLCPRSHDSVSHFKSQIITKMIRI